MMTRKRRDTQRMAVKEARRMPTIRYVLYYYYFSYWISRGLGHQNIAEYPRYPAILQRALANYISRINFILRHERCRATRRR